MPLKNREVWVDYVKVFACILVVVGHFYQSLVKSSILPDNSFYEWFNNTIYYFHVPLFFICSGYLYQKFSKIDTLPKYRLNVLKKFIALGIPYFVFSFITWILKTVFSSSTNDQIGGLFDTLFLHPTAPYWYLYTLFFIFVVTPTFKSKVYAVIGLAIALICKFLSIFVGGMSIYAVSTILGNEIWFVIGMCLCVYEFKTVKEFISVISGAMFIVLSVVLYKYQNSALAFAMGLLACFAVVEFTRKMEDKIQNNVINWLSKYTMPIFLMHTLFAAPFRTVLCKIGVSNTIVHVLGGLIISFAGPIIAAIIMQKTKYLEILLYPGKFIKIGRKENIN